MDSHWYKDAVLYDVDVRSFYDSDGDGIGDLTGLGDKLDYLQELGATAVVLEQSGVAGSPAGALPAADGPTISCSVESITNVERLFRDAHRRGMRVITALVVDEISSGALNVNHPRVRRVVLNVMRHWFDAGADGLRLDGIPNLAQRERPGDRSLAETHTLVKEMREVIDREYDGRVLIADTNRLNDGVAAYFGNGDECQMAFNASLRRSLLMALRKEDRRPIVQAVRRTPEIPASCQWALFLHNQDELRSDSWSDSADDAIHEDEAVDTHAWRDAGTCGRLAPMFENDRRRVELAYALLFSLPGSPVIYYGNEIGMGDNIDIGDLAGARTPMQWSDDRNGGFSRADPARLHTPVNVDAVYGHQVVNVTVQRRQPSSLLNWMRRLIAVRRQFTAFGRGTIEVLEPRNQRILAYIRRSGDERILVIANLSGKAQSVDLLLSLYSGAQPVELLGGTEFRRVGAGPYSLALAPYGFYWLMLSRRRARPSRSRDVAVASVSSGASAGDAAATPA